MQNPRRLLGRRIQTIPLPGDENDYVTATIHSAQRRDEHLNPEERAIHLCTLQYLHWGICLLIECPVCGGISYAEWLGRSDSRD